MQRIGFIHGTGAALNVELGFVPDHIKLVNWTDGDTVLDAVLKKVIAFTSGGLATAVDGSNEVKKGDKITGLTNTGVYATIREVILDSGSWAGGDAAGWLIFDAEDMTGTFGSENAEVNDSGGNDITVAAQTTQGISIIDTGAGTTDIASVTTLAAYTGDSTNFYRKGFTLPAALSENGKLFYYIASKNDPGMDQPAIVAGNTQADAVW